MRSVRSIEFDIDRARRIVTVRAIGDVNGRMLLAQLPAFWQAHREIAGYHSISDLTHFSGDVSLDEVREIARAWEAFCDGRDAGTCTAVVSRHPLAWMVVQAVALVLPSRRFASFRSIEAARRWIPARR